MTSVPQRTSGYECIENGELWHDTIDAAKPGTYCQFKSHLLHSSLDLQSAAGSQFLLFLLLLLVFVLVSVLLLSFFYNAVQVSISELVKSQPDAIPSVIGYNTVPGYHQLSRLHTGELLNTTDSFANVTDGSALQLTVSYGGGNTAQVLSCAWLQ